MTRWEKIFVSIVLIMFLCIALNVLIFLFPRDFQTPKYTVAEIKYEHQRVREQLPIAQTKWQNFGFQNYDIDMSFYSYRRGCVIDSTLQIRDGELIRVMEYWSRPEGEQDQIREVTHFAGDHCGYLEAVPSALFDQIDKKIAEDDLQEYLWVEFDSTYGFVTEMKIECVDQAILHCDRYWVYTNFRPIDESME